MKKIGCLFVFMAICAMAVSAQSADEAAVAKQVARLNKAIVDADTFTLKQITSEQLSYGHSGGKVETQELFITNVNKGPVFFKSIDVSDQTISIVGKDAIVRHTFFGRMTLDNKPGEVTLKILMVWHKKKGNWILLARQAVKV